MNVIQISFQFLPIAFFLMTRRTKEMYDAVFNHLIEMIPDLEPATIMSDNEGALGKSLAASFPDSHLPKCWFHFCSVSYSFHFCHLSIMSLIINIFFRTYTKM